MLTALVYHYVRDVERTAFPRIKARSIADFEGQLDYVERHYEPVSLADVRAAAKGERSLPARACLLTFDDGLSDHRDSVLPALTRRGLTGCFAASAQMILERRVANVQKSQFILAAQADRHRLVELMFAEVERQAPQVSVAELRDRYECPGRFDDAQTMLAKRLLQEGLPDEIRGPVVDALFAELVSPDEQAFAEALYVSLDELREFVRAGMEVVGHGVTHRRLELLSREQQREEISGTASFLSLVYGETPPGWTICYPSGSRNATTLELLPQAGCLLGFTIVPGLSELDRDLLELPRLDTNDLPFDGGAEPVDWTRSA